jgi:hypothetical protein
LVAQLNTENYSLGELFNALIADGDALVKVRNAKQPEAIKSCYTEQNSKWVSAAKKTGLVQEDAFLEYLSTHPRLKHVIGYKKPQTASERFHETMQGQIREKNQIQALASKYLQYILQVRNESAKEPGSVQPDLGTCAGLAQGIMSQHMLEGVTLNDPGDFAVVVDLLEQIHETAMVELPSLPARERKHTLNTVIAMNREKLLESEWGAGVLEAHAMIMRHEQHKETKS